MSDEEESREAEEIEIGTVVKTPDGQSFTLFKPEEWIKNKRTTETEQK